MNRSTIAARVDECIELERQIAEATARSKAIKQILISEAGERPAERVPSASGDGECIVFEGSDGSIGRVSFPAPTLKSSIKGEGKSFDRIRKACGSAFTTLFRVEQRYVPVTDFRNEARIVLGPSDAPKLIRMCESATSARVSFEVKKSDQ